jgi:archaellum component FlaC
MEEVREMEETLKLIVAEQKRQGDLLHQLINAVGAININFDGISKKITEIEDKVATIETKLDSVIENVKEIRATIVTKHDLEYYDQMISEHSREIYKLKNH